MTPPSAQQGHHHRSTLKQKNKTFKSRHASKGSIKTAAKGRQDSTTTASENRIGSHKPALLNNAQARRNHAKQIQLQKRQAIVDANRFHAKAPRIVAVCSLTDDIDSWQAVQALDPNADAQRASGKSFAEVELKQYRSTLQLHPMPFGALYPLLDICKAADFVLLVLSANTSVEPDSWGELAMRTMQAQGMPTVMATCLDSCTNNVRKSLLSFTRYFAPDVEKVYSLSDKNESSSMLRTMASSTPKRVAWRDFRSWLVSEEASWDASTSMLKLTGWVRGASISANRLVHIPDYGDFVVDRITDVDNDILEQREDDLADDLVSEHDVDDMQNEQTWPTEDDFANKQMLPQDDELPPAAPGTTPHSLAKAKAKWMTEHDMIAEEGARETMSEDALMEKESHPKEDDDDEDGYDDEMEERELQAYKDRQALQKEERMDQAFPDEVDTPLEIPARVRFQRYRGLQSMRTSTWDPYEDLPREYARIFQFDDYKKTRRRVEASAIEEGAEPGTRIVLWIRNVPSDAAHRACSTSPKRVPFVVFGLLRHEHKKSVLNFTIARNTEYQATVKSKDSLVLCLGPRRLRVRPIFSQHDPANDGRHGTNNVHKMERFFNSNMAVGTVVGPVTFGGANVPAVLLRERILDNESGYDQFGVSAAQMPHLLGTGNLLDADPTRIIAKRIVLTGHPFKVHKRTSTIRFMFFNAEDVRYFGPLELRSKLGRVGHISESLGTHGYFKAHFDGKVPLSQLDTVGMTLYKRTFPKFAEQFTASRLDMPVEKV